MNNILDEISGALLTLGIIIFLLNILLFTLGDIPIFILGLSISIFLIFTGVRLFKKSEEDLS